MKKDIEKECAPAINEELSVEGYILSSLYYLYNQASNDDIKALLRVAVNLCHSAGSAEKQKEDAACMCVHDEVSTNFIAALEYLQKEAGRHHLEDVSFLLEAVAQLSTILFVYQMRDQYRPFSPYPEEMGKPN